MLSTAEEIAKEDKNKALPVYTMRCRLHENEGEPTDILVAIGNQHLQKEKEKDYSVAFVYLLVEEKEYQKGFVGGLPKKFGVKKIGELTNELRSDETTPIRQIQTNEFLRIHGPPKFIQDVDPNWIVSNQTLLQAVTKSKVSNDTDEAQVSKLGQTITSLDKIGTTHGELSEYQDAGNLQFKLYTDLLQRFLVYAKSKCTAPIIPTNFRVKFRSKNRPPPLSTTDSTVIHKLQSWCKLESLVVVKNDGNGDCFYYCILNLFRYTFSNPDSEWSKCLTPLIIRTMIVNAMNQDEIGFNYDMLTDELKKEEKIEYKAGQGMRDYMLTKKYWADHTDLNKTATLLKIGIISINSDAANDTTITTQLKVTYHGPISKPAIICEQCDLFAIVMYRDRNHYENVQLDKKDTKLVYLFEELPYGLLETMCTGLNANDLMENLPQLRTWRNTMTTGGGAASSILMTKKGERMEEEEEDVDPHTVFVFGLKASTKALPGKEENESIEPSRVAEFAELISFPRWRRQLALEWMDPKDLIFFDGHAFLSAYHIVQYLRLLRVVDTLDFAYEFTVDSASAISKSVELAKCAMSKTGKDKNDKVIRPDTIAYPTVTKKEWYTHVHRALYAKFTSHPKRIQLLLATKNARLVDGKKGIIADAWMRVRRQLQTIPVAMPLGDEDDEELEVTQNEPTSEFSNPSVRIVY